MNSLSGAIILCAAAYLHVEGESIQAVLFQFTGWGALILLKNK